MSEARIRIVAAVVTVVGLTAAGWSFVYVDGRTFLSNLIGIAALAITALAAYTTWQPRQLFVPDEEDQDEDEDETRTDTQESSRTKKRKHQRKDVGHVPYPESSLPFAHQSQPLVGSSELAQDLKAIRKTLDVISANLAAMRTDVPQRLLNLQQTVESNTAVIGRSLRELRSERSGGPTPPQGAFSRSSSNDPVAAAEPFVDLRDRPRERDDDAVQSVLQPLANKCMGRGLSVRRVRDELPNEWKVDALDSSETPDAFLVHVSNNETWVVPNTREWMPFRDKGWFDVQGLDVANARITMLRRLPVLGKSKNVLVRGAVEVAVQ